MIHALKPNPKSHIQEGWRIMDFFSHVPESCNMFTFLFDDIGIPRTTATWRASGSTPSRSVVPNKAVHFFHVFIARASLERRWGGGG